VGKLKNHAKAFINLEKLTEYCLNEFHPHGKDKATVFKSVLGIGESEAELLRNAILKGILENDCVAKEQDEYGERFSVKIKINIFQKEAVVVTGWIIRTAEDYPRLTTCYIKKEKK
jgi:hypothetical protein